MNLYAISSEMQAVIDAMLEGGADSPEAMAALDEHLKGLDTALEEKAERYAAVILELKARAEARAREADRIRTLASIDNKVMEQLADRLKQAMSATGRTRIDGATVRLSVVRNGGKTPLRVDVEADQLPTRFQRVVSVTTANNDAIREALEAGEAVPGCALLERGTRLAIR